MRYLVTMPVVGKAYAEVEADSEAEALEAALYIDWDDLDIEEMYVTDKVGEGNINYHPCFRANVEKIDED